MAINNFFNNIRKEELTIAGIIILGAIAIPLTLFVIKQQENIQQNAQLNQVSNHDSCGRIQFSFSQNPSGGNICQIGVATHTNSYTYTIKISSLTGNTHSFVYNTYNYFCPEGYLGNANCLEGAQEHTGIVGHTGDTITITRSPDYGSYCGRYQFDFKVTSVDNNTSCNFFGGNNTNAGSSGSCETGATCQKTSSTPTPTITPTITQKLSPTPTITRENTPSPTVTKTITATPTQMTTNSPTISESPTVSPSETPTSEITTVVTTTTTTNVTNSVNQTATPTVGVVGPGNIYINIGLGSIGIIAIGALLFLAI